MPKLGGVGVGRGTSWSVYELVSVQVDQHSANPQKGAIAHKALTVILTCLISTWDHFKEISFIVAVISDNTEIFIFSFTFPFLSKSADLVIIK